MKGSRKIMGNILLEGKQNLPAPRRASPCLRRNGSSRFDGCYYNSCKYFMGNLHCESCDHYHNGVLKYFCPSAYKKNSRCHKASIKNQIKEISSGRR